MGKIKESITLEERISLFQTCMNNSGRNFEGKRVKAKKMADYAMNLYKLSIKEIENIGELSFRQMVNTIKQEPVLKVKKNSEIKGLMKKINNKKTSKRKK